MAARASKRIFTCQLWSLFIRGLRSIVEFFADLLNTDKPDERAIMTYVSCYYHAFQGAMQASLLECRLDFVYSKTLYDPSIYVCVTNVTKNELELGLINNAKQCFLLTNRV